MPRIESFIRSSKRIFEWMKKLDKEYAQGPDCYIANSSIVAKRIKENYEKDAVVINYPIDSSKFIFLRRKRGLSILHQLV
jgi:hypothetical protein